MKKICTKNKEFAISNTAKHQSQGLVAEQNAITFKKKQNIEDTAYQSHNQKPSYR